MATLSAAISSNSTPFATFIPQDSLSPAKMAQWITRLDLTQPVDEKAFTSEPLQKQQQRLLAILAERYSKIGLGALTLTPISGAERAHALALQEMLHKYWSKYPKIELNHSSPNQIDKALPLIFAALETCETPIELSVTEVKLSKTNLMALCKAIETGQISALELTSDSLTDTEAVELAKAVSSAASNVFKMVMDHNLISDEGAVSFIPRLRQEKPMMLLMNGNFISKDKQEALQKIAEIGNLFSVFEAADSKPFENHA